MMARADANGHRRADVFFVLLSAGGSFAGTFAAGVVRGVGDPIQITEIALLLDHHHCESGHNVLADHTSLHN